MSFVSRSQEKAAFGGYLGAKMKRAAPQRTSLTPKKLPEHAIKAGIQRAIKR